MISSIYNICRLRVVSRLLRRYCQNCAKCHTEETKNLFMAKFLGIPAEWTGSTEFRCEKGFRTEAKNYCDDWGHA